jgi:hypothetical protein
MMKRILSIVFVVLLSASITAAPSDRAVDREHREPSFVSKIYSKIKRLVTFGDGITPPIPAPCDPSKTTC